MESVILNYAPDYWDKDDYSVSNKYTLDTYSNEYRQIYDEVCAATNSRSWTRIQRNQSLYDMGQMIVREQLKIKLTNNSVSFYRVRRFIAIKRQFLSLAIHYNLDYRRCGLRNLEFKRQVTNLTASDVLLAVLVITSTPENSVIVPENSSDYVIDYIIQPN